MAEAPKCPIHKSTLRQLSSPLPTKQESLAAGTVVVLECSASGCLVKYSLEVAPDWDGFFKLDESGKPIPLSSAVGEA